MKLHCFFTYKLKLMKRKLWNKSYIHRKRSDLCTTPLLVGVFKVYVLPGLVPCACVCFRTGL